MKDMVEITLFKEVCYSSRENLLMSIAAHSGAQRAYAQGLRTFALPDTGLYCHPGIVSARMYANDHNGRLAIIRCRAWAHETFYSKDDDYPIGGWPDPRWCVLKWRRTKTRTTFVKDQDEVWDISNHGFLIYAKSLVPMSIVEVVNDYHKKFEAEIDGAFRNFDGALSHNQTAEETCRAILGYGR